MRTPTVIRPVTSGLGGISTAELLAEADEAVPFHTPDLIPAEGLVVLAAPPKVGKTILMSQLALVTGSEDGPPRPLFLGREVMPGRVLYVLEEGSRASLRNRVRRQMEGLAMGRSAVTWALQAHVRLDNPQSVKDLRARVREVAPTLVILDPLNRLHGLDENRPSEMARVMGAAVTIVQEAHCRRTWTRGAGSSRPRRRSRRGLPFRGRVGGPSLGGRELVERRRPMDPLAARDAMVVLATRRAIRRAPRDDDAVGLAVWA